MYSTAKYPGVCNIFKSTHEPSEEQAKLPWGSKESDFNHNDPASLKFEIELNKEVTMKSKGVQSGKAASLELCHTQPNYNPTGPSKTISNPHAGENEGMEHRNGVAPVTSRRLYIKNIPFSIQEAELRHVMKKQGEVESCYICKNKRRYKSKTDYGFVTFVHQIDARKLLDRRNIKLKKYKTKLIFRSFKCSHAGIDGNQNLTRETRQRKITRNDQRTVKFRINNDHGPILKRNSSLKKNGKRTPFLDFSTQTLKKISNFHSKVLVSVKDNHFTSNIRFNR